MQEIAPGLTGEAATIVRDADTATRHGSGLVSVYATPALVGLMERAAVEALRGHLPSGHTTVGGRMDVHHLAPTPVGMRVRACAELLRVHGRRLVFDVQAWDEVERIGQATHERFLVDAAAFVARATAKGAATAASRGTATMA
jgi:fluoroacetyl-CoA thioesterase